MNAFVGLDGHPDNRVLGDLDPSPVSLGKYLRGAVALNVDELVNQPLAVACDGISATAQLPAWRAHAVVDIVRCCGTGDEHQQHKETEHGMASD